LFQNMVIQMTTSQSNSPVRRYPDLPLDCMAFAKGSSPVNEKSQAPLQRQIF
jgi:hypothetical protein